MDFVRQQLAVVQERLAGLSASQKMLTAALAVILVMTMLYWGKISATPDRVAVLPNALAGDELVGVENALRARGIDYTVDGGKVMVAADKQVEALGELSYNQALPANANPLDAMFDKVSPWDSSSAFDVRVINAKQQSIAGIMRTWPGVKKADVLITDAPTSALSRREPRAAISIQTRGVSDGDKRKVANSARSFALNCVSGLTDKFMTVTVDMQSFAADGNGGVGGGGEMLEQISNYELARADQLRNQLSSIPGVLVQVSAEMDTTTKKETKHSVEAKDKYAEVIESEHKTSTPVAAPAPAQEPGVVANTNLDIRANAAPTSGGGGTATDETTEKSVADVGRTDTETNTPAGTCHLIGATVGVPRSYFVAIWHKKHPKQGDPDADPPEDELKALTAEHLKGIREYVTSLTKLKSADEVTVSDYFDLDPIVGGPVLAAASPGAAANLTLLATGHARELAIGVLAVSSLFMVSRMVKKAAPSPLALAGVGGLNLMVADDDADGIQAVGGRKKAPPKVLGGEEVAAEVGDSAAVMFGHELDADVLETSQMIEQVSGFVKQNPDAAAQMIGRWMNRE